MESTKIIMIVSEYLRVGGFVCTVEENAVKGYSKSPAAALRFKEERAREIAEGHNLKYKNKALVIESSEMYEMIKRFNLI